MANSRYELGGNGTGTAALDVAPQPGHPHFRLLGVVGGATVSLDLPTGAKTTIGRSAEADVAIVHPTISRVHAAFFVTSSGEALRCEVEDLGSLNGTRVRGERLSANERVELRAGDTVDLGSTTFVVQRRHGASQPPRPAPVLLGSAPTTRSLAEAVEVPIPPPLSLQAELDEVERERLLRVLKDCEGDRDRAALCLGICRASLDRRIESAVRAAFSEPSNR